MLKRQKRRYLLVQVSSAFEVGQEEFLATVWRSVEKLYGEYGTSKTGLWLIAFDTDRKLAILRAMNSGVDIVRTALAYVTKIGDATASLRVLRVSGTIRSLQDKMNK